MRFQKNIKKENLYASASQQVWSHVLPNGNDYAFMFGQQVVRSSVSAIHWLEGV